MGQAKQILLEIVEGKSSQRHALSHSQMVHGVVHGPTWLASKKGTHLCGFQPTTTDVSIPFFCYVLGLRNDLALQWLRWAHHPRCLMALTFLTSTSPKG
jgi:hypothetical protein